MSRLFVILFSLLVSLQADELQGTCSALQACAPGIILPVWQPQGNITRTTIIFRALVYFLILCYLFFGVSIVAERFMAAIEVITSQEREVKLRKITGEPYTILIRIWNETVSNLTLMALGSSAPEILLSVIEIFGNNFEAGDLGPGTIVGSAAFNLFIIIAICISAVPSNETRKVQHNVVFWVTVLWSTFAYVWLYLIISVFSPGIIQIWEGLITFLCFPLTVVTAYAADRWTGAVGKRLLTIGAQMSFDGGSIKSPRRRISIAKGAGNTFENRSSLLSQLDAEVMAHEAERRKYLEIFWKLRADNPDASATEIERLALERILAEKPKSRAFYRVMTTRKIIGGAIGTQNKLKAESSVCRVSEAETEYKKKQAVVGFDPAYYVCLENVGAVKLQVRCDRSAVDEGTVVSVSFKTVAGTAEEYSDFIPTSGTLTFLPGEDKKEIAVTIVNNDVYEEDEQFLVLIRQAKAYKFGDQTARIPVRVNVSTATVVVVDDDHAGAFGFSSEKFKVVESDGVFVAEILRTRGARGEVSVPYKTTDGVAKAGKDYVGIQGMAHFKDEQTMAEIKIEIVNDDEYEKSADFYLELGEPIWHDKTKDPANDPGRPILSSHPRCKIVIVEDQEFANFIDRVVSNASTSLMVGTHSWKQQFTDALQIYEEDEDNSTLAQSVKILALPWKLLFAVIPPTDYLNGWLCFFVAVVMIGFLTAVIGDLASHFGCTIGLKDSVTAITLVAMGTSVPDTFASRTAAVQDDWADSSIGNVTGSNAVNVFLGIGIAWAIAAIYHAIHGTTFRVEAGNLAFSVTIFLIGSAICIFVLQYRHFSSKINGELGGPKTTKILSSLIFVVVWIAYIGFSFFEAYCIIPGF